MNVLINLIGDEQAVLKQNDINKLELIYAHTLTKKKIVPNEVKYIEISVAFVNKAKMAELNSKYRNITEATDVLSFPMWESETGEFSPPLHWDFLPLGDIVVCNEIIKQNANENKKEFIAELLLVISHGLLHLIGYDHDTSERKQAMWIEQDEIVSEYFKS